MTLRTRRFAVQEINEILPRVDAILTTLTAKKEDYARLHDLLLMHELLVQEAPLGPGYDPGKKLEHEARDLDNSLASSFEKEIRQLQEIGCVIRDLEKGQVDFPGKYQGRNVCFCWTRGEKAIQHYRFLTDGSDKRRPVEL